MVEFVDNDPRYLESEKAWSLSPGDRIRRTELHARYGGRRQGGIAPSAKTPNVFIFTDRDVGKKHGYLDRWEGDTFLYVGEGQRGNQRMEQGNRAILEHVSQGRALRLFEGSSGEVTYVGEFAVDPSAPYHLERAPETGNGPLRDVIVFRLRPVGEFLYRGRVHRPETAEPTLSTPYRDLDENVTTSPRKPFEIDPDAVDRASRTHIRLQNELASQLRSLGIEPQRPGFGDPKFDIGWWWKDTFVVAEVKSLSPENEVLQLQLGLGQTLDYVNSLECTGKRSYGLLAIPRPPSDDRWISLCESHGVRLIWPPFDRKTLLPPHEH